MVLHPRTFADRRLLLRKVLVFRASHFLAENLEVIKNMLNHPECQVYCDRVKGANELEAEDVLLSMEWNKWDKDMKRRKAHSCDGQVTSDQTKGEQQGETLIQRVSSSLRPAPHQTDVTPNESLSSLSAIRPHSSSTVSTKLSSTRCSGHWLPDRPELQCTKSLVQPSKVMRSRATNTRR